METIKNMVKGCVKNGAVLFMVGALLAVAAPHIASFFHVSEAVAGAHDVLWTAAFFGGFGAIHGAVGPLVDFAFGSDKKGEKASAPEREKMQQVFITLEQPHEPGKTKQVNWQECVQARRAGIEQQTPGV